MVQPTQSAVKSVVWDFFGEPCPIIFSSSHLSPESIATDGIITIPCHTLCTSHDFPDYTCLHLSILYAVWLIYGMH